MTDTPSKIQHFVNYARSLKGYEKGEAQLFCDRLFQAFGHRGCVEAGAKLEYRLKSQGKHTKFPDLVWRPRLLLEMKSRGENLAHHIQQAREYWHELKPQPRYIVLCNFDEFWIYDTALQIEEPVSRVNLQELPQQYNILNFLFPNNSALDLYQKATNYCENIPLSGAAQLLGRSHEIQKLKELLQQEDGQAIAVILGMGGVGKTELANQYAWQHLETLGDRAGGVCWIDAREIDIGIQFINFARSFFNLNPPEDWDLKTQLNYCWRNWRCGNWLIVIDDVTDYRKQVKPYLPPQTSPFKILITTREKLGSSLAHLSLDELKAEAALDLLISLVGAQRIQPELEIAQQICNWLGYLPLGLELVGRYLERDPDLSLKAMLSLLEKKRIRHRSVVEADATMTAKLGVADAFDLSWERLDENAQQLGCMLSLFALADIPWDLVKQAYRNLPSFDNAEIEIDFIEEARVDLVRCNLLQRTGKETYRLHQLIREYLREKREQSEQVNDFNQAFVDAIVAVAKQVPEPGKLSCQLIDSIFYKIPHLAEPATTLMDWLSGEDIFWPSLALGRFYKAQYLYEQAEHFYQQCLNLTQTRLGVEHPYLAISLSNLAELYREQGRYKEAEPLFLEALEIWQKLPDKDENEPTMILNNLALLYEEQGRYSEAERLFLQALELNRSSYGEEHTYVVGFILHNLGNLYQQQGRYSEAESIAIQAVKIRIDLLGNDNPITAMTINNLAAVYISQSRHSEAEPLLLQALEIIRRTRGEEHREVATCLSNLASLYISQGRYSQAESLLLEALELDKRLLGEEHPELVTDLSNLANFYQSQLRYSEAETLYRQALELGKRVVAHNHPMMATSLKDLADIYYSQGRYSEAETLYKQALELEKCRLGEDHPELAKNLNILAHLYHAQGRYSEAETLYRQAWDMRKQLLVEDDPNVANSLHNLAYIYQEQGRYTEAETLYKQAVKLKKRLIGEEDNEVAVSLNNLALLYYNQKRYTKAEPLLAEACKIFQRRLGTNHPDTINCRKGLAIVRDRIKSTSTELPNFKYKPHKSGTQKNPKGFGKA
ncbi:tetratricopeptide repeat protein [Microseira sp. BLCC-F43]|jgi:tetratricopeptide (TPR) repeat protein|uniref:tetratricopeptide repeat protein n=1 Tax=Microseira sp. BLCC-F43 TaxID=3153602 RepID=UPI0035BA8A88